MVSESTLAVSAAVSRARVSQLRRHDVHGRFHGRVCRSCAGMMCMAGVDPKWSHIMAYALALDARTWPRGDVPSLGLIDEDVDLLKW